jgi:hypothetical protein
VSVATLQNWEQGRRKPEGPAQCHVSIKIIDAITASSWLERRIGRHENRRTCRNIETGLSLQ